GMFGMCVNSLLASYEHLVRNSCFPPPMAVRHRPDGQVIAAVFPATALDKAFAPGFRGEVWLAPGEDAPRQPLPGCRPAVCAVLGAGNYDAPVEMLGKLFVDGHAVVYK